MNPPPLLARCLPLLAITPLVAASLNENFNAQPQGAFTSLATAVGSISAPSGQAAVYPSTTATPTSSMRLTGGTCAAQLSPALSAASNPLYLSFNAERWTSTTPFTFRVVAVNGSGVRTEILNGDASVKVGQSLPQNAVIPTGTVSVRFEATTPTNKGVLIDDVVLSEPSPMSVTSATTFQPVCPVLVRKVYNPVMAFNLYTTGTQAISATTVRVNLNGTTNPADLQSVRLVYTGATRDFSECSTAKTDLGSLPGVAGSQTFVTNQTLQTGDNWFWVMAEPTAAADLDHRVDAEVEEVTLSDGATKSPAPSAPTGSQRIGLALRKQGDDASVAYRIPGLATTNAGTLIAVYDIRYAGGGDLPANIDVGMSRSTDGGKTWAPMKVIIDMGTGTSNGVGDPTVFVDKGTGRVWAAALWGSNGKAYNTSGPGLDPSVTGQLVLTYSDDDGVTWATPYSITSQVKDPAWKLLFNGPGTGITASDGTLVFPAQYRLGDAAGTVYSTIIYSRDHGATWSIGRGAMPRTNEAQVAQLADGSLMLNCRSESGGGLRRVAITRNYGASWSVLTPRTGATSASDLSLLADPTCQGCLYRYDHASLGSAFYFSNPDSTSGRRNMTVKVSKTNARTWPLTLRTLYDYRTLSGYSCLSAADADHLGILYEGPTEIWFLRIPFTELHGVAP